MLFEHIAQNSITFKTKKRLANNLPYINLKLLKERSILLIILIFGESIFVVSDTFSFDHFKISIFITIIIFLQISFFFLKIYYDTKLLHLNKADEHGYLFTVYVGSGSFLVLFSILGLIGERAIYHEAVTAYEHIVIVVLLIFYASFHLLNNIGYLKGFRVFFHYNRDLTFSKIDAVSNIIMLILAYSTIFISNATVFLIITLVFFFLHLVTTISDYKKADYLYA